MPADFPLWRLRPEDAARIIILEPLRPVEKHKFWYKRKMRLKPSSKTVEPYLLRGARYKPREDDLKLLASATHDSQWEAWAEEWAKAFPRIGVLYGPMRRDGSYFSQSQHSRPEKPLATDRPREPWTGLYSREQFELDEQYFESARALLRENFILGQRKEGPYLDGLVYTKVDSLLLAEIAHCKAKLQMTWAILEQARKMKQQARPKPKQGKVEAWHNIGNDEAIAMQFKHSGHTIRKIDTLSNRHYEVLMK